jgi:hypothetical protein
MNARPAVVRCYACGAERWAGLGPCRSCGAASPEFAAETKRINKARAEAGLAPLVADEGSTEVASSTPGDNERVEES